MERVTRSFSGEAGNVRAARRFIAEIADRWSLGDLEWPLVQIVSELASNAILHAGTAFSVRLSRDGEAIRVEVVDGSARRAQSRDYDVDATTGRGLRLVEQLSREWGVSSKKGGKVVWAVVDSDSWLEAEPDEAQSLLDFTVDDDLDDRPPPIAARLHDDWAPPSALLSAA